MFIYGRKNLMVTNLFSIGNSVAMNFIVDKASQLCRYKTGGYIPCILLNVQYFITAELFNLSYKLS
jgi:hypothetical protein